MCRRQGYLDWFLENRELPLIFVDNKSALAVSQNTLVTKKTKHLNLRYHEVKDYVDDLCYCPTDLNKADPLTKSLPIRKCLGILRPIDPTDCVEHEDERDSYNFGLCASTDFCELLERKPDLDPITTAMILHCVEQSKSEYSK